MATSAPSYKPISLTGLLSREEFLRVYVDTATPVLMKGAVSHWTAVNGWSPEFFVKLGGQLDVTVKTGDVSAGCTEKLALSEYATRLETYHKALAQGQTPQSPPYLHDIPLFHLLPELRRDIGEFPAHLFPPMYRQRWYDYVQFFMGGAKSLTPLHFDTLYTHNLFFQITGTKRFILVPHQQRHCCYMTSWRWAGVDAMNPDLAAHPRFADATPVEAIVEPGDVLYIPAGTLHQVRGSSFTVSFNIDWHTPRSLFVGLTSFLRGAPSRNIYFNAVIALSLLLHIPPRLLFRYYKPYLNYIS